MVSWSGLQDLSVEVRGGLTGHSQTSKQLATRSPSRHPISTFQAVAPGHFRDWSLITWRGYKTGVGASESFPL